MLQLKALILSIVIEAAVAALMAALMQRGSEKRFAAAAAAGTLLSHPFAWNGNIMLVGLLPFVTRVALVEGAITAGEVLAYRYLARAPWPKAALTSVLANAASYFTGVLILRYWPWFFHG